MIKHYFNIEPGARPQVTVLPLLLDCGSSQAGSAKGPGAILKASDLIETYDQRLDIDISDLQLNCDPPVKLKKSEPVAKFVERAKAASLKIQKTGALPFGLGGEHTVAVPLVAALKENHGTDFSIVVFDAHSDMRDSFEGDMWSHSTSTKKMVQMGFSPWVVGVRSYEPHHANAGAGFITPADVRNGDWTRMLKTLKSKVYISVDVDALDPSEMPAVSNPEPGGLTWDQFTDVLPAICDKRQLIGADIVELVPNLGPPYAAVTTARIMLRMLALIKKQQTT